MRSKQLKHIFLILFTVFVLYLPFSLAEETKPVKYTFLVGNYLTPTVVKAIKKYLDKISLSEKPHKF